MSTKAKQTTNKNTEKKIKDQVIDFVRGLVERYPEEISPDVFMQLPEMERYLANHFYTNATEQYHMRNIVKCCIDGMDNDEIKLYCKSIGMNTNNDNIVKDDTKSEDDNIGGIVIDIPMDDDNTNDTVNAQSEKTANEPVDPLNGISDKILNDISITLNTPSEFKQHKEFRKIMGIILSPSSLTNQTDKIYEEIQNIVGKDVNFDTFKPTIEKLKAFSDEIGKVLNDKEYDKLESTVKDIISDISIDVESGEDTNVDVPKRKEAHIPTADELYTMVFGDIEVA